MFLPNQEQPLECAERICDIVLQTIAAHPTPLNVDCNVTGDADTAKITLSMNDGSWITWGNFNITVHPPKPVVTKVEPTKIAAGEIVTITGKNFKGNPNNMCIFLKGEKNGFIDIEPISVTEDVIIGKLPPQIPLVAHDVPHQLAVAIGEEGRGLIPLNEEEAKGVEVKKVWQLRAEEENMVVAPMKITPLRAEDNELPAFFSGGPQNGVLCVTIDEDWEAGMEVCINARVHQQCTGGDTRIAAQFNIEGSATDCAKAIAGLIQRSFAAHTSRPLHINTDVATTVDGAKITISMANGLPIIGGNVSITVKKPDCPYQIQDLEVNCTDENFMVCVDAIESLNGVSGLDFTFTHPTNIQHTGTVVYGPLVINSTGGNPNWVGNFISSPQAGTTTASFYFSPVAPNNTTFNGSGGVACFEFASNAEIDVASFEITGAIEEAYPNGDFIETCAESGTVTVDLTAAKGVFLKVWGNNPLPGDPSNSITDISELGGACNVLTPNITTLNGNGSFVVPHTVDFLQVSRLNPSCNPLFPAVEAFDLFRILQISGLSADFIPNIYQLKAADVDGNGRVNAGDATRAAARSIGTDCSYPLGNSEVLFSDWIFEEEDVVLNDPTWLIDTGYPNDTDVGADRRNVPLTDQCLQLNPPITDECDTTQTNIVAILKGDLDGTNVASNFKQALTGRLIINLDKATTPDKVDYHVPVYVEREEGEALDALSFQVKIDQTKHSFKRINTLGYDFNIINENYLEESGVLIVVAVPKTYIPVSEPILEIVFETKVEELCVADFSNYEGYLNGTISDMVVLLNTSVDCLDLSGVTTDIDPHILANFSLRVYPNPASENVTLQHTALQTSAEITFYNLLGEKVKTIPVSSKDTHHHIDLQEFSKGVYFVKLSHNGYGLATSKLIVE